MKKARQLSDNGTPKSLMFLTARIILLKLNNLARIHVAAACVISFKWEWEKCLKRLLIFKKKVQKNQRLFSMRWKQVIIQQH
jgi:hypothetical protein